MLTRSPGTVRPLPATIGRLAGVCHDHPFAAAALLYAAALLGTLIGGSSSVEVGGLLVAVPLLVAQEGVWRWTAASAVVPFAVLTAGSVGGDPLGVAVSLVAAVVGTALALWASTRRGRDRVLLTRTRAVADAAQRAILPVVPPRLGPLELSSLYRSAAEEARVGGDFYKVIRGGGGTRMIVGDVEGKGLAAVSMSSLVLGCFREWAPRVPTLEELVEVLDQRVRDYEERSAFVTAVVATATDDLALEIANCGHLPPVLARGGRLCPLVPPQPTTPLGLGSRPAIQRMCLQPGDRLFFYTDGLTETRTPTGEWVTLDELVGGLATDPFRQALDHVSTRLTARGVLRDDLAMLLAEVSPSPGADAGP